MLKTQRILLNVLAILFLALTIILVVQNLAIQVPVQFLTGSATQVSLGLLLAASAVLAALAVAIKAGERGLISGQQQRHASRELERKDVSREEAEAKVKVLENKVQTLEKALHEALKSRT